MLVGFSQGGCQVILFHCFEFFISLISLLSLLGFSDMAGRLEGCLSEGVVQPACLCSASAYAVPPRACLPRTMVPSMAAVLIHAAHKACGCMSLIPASLRLNSLLSPSCACVRGRGQAIACALQMEKRLGGVAALSTWFPQGLVCRAVPPACCVCVCCMHHCVRACMRACVRVCVARVRC